MLYGLLSLPFFLFALPLLFEVLTHARATGYDEYGRCVRVLSARERQLKRQGAKHTRTHQSVERLSQRYGVGDGGDGGSSDDGGDGGDHSCGDIGGGGGGGRAGAAARKSPEGGGALSLV